LDAAAGLAATGVAVVAILHDLNLAAAYADRLLVLDGGRLVAGVRPGYRYTIVNDQPVLVDRGHRIVEVID
ncbi:hypothetical protein OMR07_29570, partial [Methylobacterium organophilum]|nr:hypothetical protein [Methylobacterium organophilum]